MVDPTTGLPRLIFGNDQGVWSVLDNNGQFQIAPGVTVAPTTGETSAGEIGGTTLVAGMNRNGNLQITQFYYGAAQPSNLGGPDRDGPPLWQCPGQRRPRVRSQCPAGWKPALVRSRR
jgi:hypothetical protein